MVSNIQAMALICIRASQLAEQGKTTMGQIAFTKATCSKLAREVVAMARELMGGNGILLENKVMTHFLDAEAIHSYEGTYDINALLAAREITGVAAFK